MIALDVVIVSVHDVGGVFGPVGTAAVVVAVVDAVLLQPHRQESANGGGRRRGECC